MGSVWPVRGPEGEPLMVKLTDAHHEQTLEGDALAAWSAQPLSRSYVVALLDRATDLDGSQEALLSRCSGNCTISCGVRCTTWFCDASWT